MLRILAITVVLACTWPAVSSAAAAGEIRSAAERLANWAHARGDRAVVAGAVSTMIAHGARPDAQDPWTGRFLDMVPDWFAAELARIRRGVARGCERCVLEVAPDSVAAVRLVYAGSEGADAEVRLQRGSGDADIDLVVRTDGGRIVAQDTGPDTGTLGVGSYVQWQQESCARLTVEIVNNGPEIAHVVFLASSSRQPGCDVLPVTIQNNLSADDAAAVPDSSGVAAD